jgi:5-methylcytosine-specific restriction protein A
LLSNSPAFCSLSSHSHTSIIFKFLFQFETVIENKKSLPWHYKNKSQKLEQLPFIPNQTIKRSEIHDRFGGSRMSGISPTANFPYIFIFTGAQGKQHGYEDAWDNPNVFSYTGEGQAGDMKFIKGNLALREHKENGKRVFLFEYVSSGIVKFITELVVFDFDFFETFDSSKKLRQGIRFFFHKAGVIAPKTYDLFSDHGLAADMIPGYDYLIPNKTERSGLVTSRVGQGAYRKRIIHRWEYKCAVTGFSKPEILIASHITPWKDSSDAERLDVNNGILLSPVYDALFDRHLISFENTGKIILSNSIAENAYQKIGVNGKEIIKSFNTDNKVYLEKHRLQLQ